MQITYQKRDGSIIQKYRNTPLPYKIGDTTSMNWKVLNIEYEYKNKFYPEYKYDMLRQKDIQATIKRKQNTELFVNEFKAFLYCFISMLIMYFVKKMLGI